MTDFPPLEIDYWIYTIGPKGGLYHQYKGSKEGPTRIHNSHPPITHQPIVKEWQDRYLEQKGLSLPKRFNPTYPKIPIVKSEIKLLKAVKLSDKTSNEISTKLSNKTLDKTRNKIPNKTPNKTQSKVSKKKSQNLSAQQIESLLAEPVKEQILVCEAKKCVLLPLTKAIAYENVNKITRQNNKFIPEWVAMNLSEYLDNNSTQIYYSNDIELEDARTYATERSLKLNDDSSLLGFDESFYGSKKSLDVLKGLLGFYCDADVSFDNGKTKHKLHIYQGGEPLLNENSENNRAVYEQIFAKMFLCALNNKMKTIILQVDNCLNSMKDIFIALLAILRNVKTVSIHFVGNNEFLVPIQTEFTAKTFTSLEEAIKSNSPSTTMFASLCDMRFVLSNSMFSSCSSLPLHIYGLTNTNLNNDNAFIIY